ncbi:MAG TPA: NAD(P)/FAD-dependent oxidoreductase [Burkholderiaceae bacterium]|nr:NAD(P)/FAD-dependent oxidoreductase [Burkholderiaceae bacterium]
MTHREPNDYDVAVIGAGAAGMMCAAVAGQRGARVVLIDHATKLAEKIRISGGGRCNFTNVDAALPERYLSENPHFARSALARYTPADFIALVKRHRIAFHEKHKGQLFCDDSAEQIIAMLQAECGAGNVQWRMPCTVSAVRRAGQRYELDTDAGTLRTSRVVIATGGLSIPKIGATDFGYCIARQFGLRIVEPRPALVPLTFDAEAWRPFVQLAGVSHEVCVTCGDGSFDEDLLFTHRGLSGPAILQISSYWNPRETIQVDLVPTMSRAALTAALLQLKHGSRQTLPNALATLLPRRLAEQWSLIQGHEADQRIAEVPDTGLRALATSLKEWRLTPSGTEGFRKAEVTRGGVATDELSQASLEAHKAPGLHFIGEVVDVTGWLGGYNFQWAWASAVAAGAQVAG